MPDVNIVVLAGRLTRDPEMRYTPNGTAVAQLGMAIGRKWKDNSGQVKEETTFVDVTAWGRQAETCSQYLSKGHALLIQGELRLEQWEDKATGQKRSKLKVNATSVQFMGAPKNAQKQQPHPKSQSEGPADIDIREDDIPF